MYRRHVLVSLVALAMTVTVACGGDGDDDGQADRTVDVLMKNLAFVPATLAVKKGETVTFRFKNGDAVKHDAFVGDEAAQVKHGQDMNAGGGHGHDEGEDAVDVDAGETKTLTYTFDKSGTIFVGCHEPGHYAAGMKMTITVT